MEWFIGGDSRAYWAVDYLVKQGVPIATQGVPGWEDRPLPEHISCLMLPMPVTDLQRERVLPTLDPNSLVIGGRFGKYRQSIEATGARIRELYDTEPLTTLNAVATVEGALALLIRESEITLWGSSCLVIGGGRIGMLLGERLKLLGAEVTVAVRSAKDTAFLRSRSMIPEETGKYHRGLGRYDYVINTVPAPVLEGSHLEQLKTSCILLELASDPGGFSMEECEASGRKGIRGSGLPGKFSPKTAGALYGECLLEILKREGIL